MTDNSNFDIQATEAERKLIFRIVTEVIDKYRLLLNDKHIDSVIGILNHVQMNTDDKYGNAVVSRVFYDLAKFVLQSNMTDAAKFGVSSSLKQVFKLVVEEGKSLLDDDVARLSPQVGGIIINRNNFWFWQHRNLDMQLFILRCFGGTLGIDFDAFVEFYKSYDYSNYIFNVLSDVAG